MLSRFNLENQIYFVTTKTFNNKRIFKDDRNCKLFVEILKDCKKRYRFKLYGYVIIPDHVHLLIVPDNKINISEAIHRIKGNFAYQYLMARNHKGSATRDEYSYSRVADPLWVGGMKRKRIKYKPTWQKSFYDHVIRNQKDFIEKINYIHKNPLKHNVTKNLDKYLWSSYQNYYVDNNNLIKIDKMEIYYAQIH